MSQETEKKPLRLKSFSVEGLFGFLDHTIDFKTQDRITILHGPNGVGKTSVLRLIEGMFEPGSRIWNQVTFGRVTAKFIPHGTLTIEPGRDDAEIRYAFRRGGEKREATVSRRETRHLPFHMIENLLPWLQRIGPRRWRDQRTGAVLEADAILDMYEDHLPRGFVEDGRPVPVWLSELLAGVSTQFIRTHRLRSEPRPDAAIRHRGPGPKEHVVEELAEGLSVRIREDLRKSGSLAASLDRTFPSRLLAGRLPAAATEAAIRGKYKEQEDMRVRLMRAGLLDSEEVVPLPSAGLDEAERKVLWYYLNDVNERLSVYLPLLDRVELFKQIIDEKNFLFKEMEVSQLHGFRFKSATGDEVPLGSLSSGEQHELVLTYELLFGSRGKQLILIDEPELSLHVLWQQRFLDDMKKIANLADLDFVIATHSPSIVSHRTDLMVELSGRTRA